MTHAILFVVMAVAAYVLWRDACRMDREAEREIEALRKMKGGTP